jgi:UDP-N-acetylmuramate dehydrogenase
MTRDISDLFENSLGSHLIKMAPLSSYTTIHVGGPADILVEIQDIKVLEKVVMNLWKKNVPITLLGGCSNILVSESGIRGAVILNRCAGLKVMDSEDNPKIWAESGLLLRQFSKAAVEAGFTGMEWASLIPGTVGGAVYGNAGAHGGEICKNLILAEILHRTKGRLSLSNIELGFSYRNSLFKKEKGDHVILSATFQFTRGKSEVIQSMANALIEKRRETQPQGASFGSTFRNPVGHKAGKLIDEAGLKGERFGDAVISEKHANFIINEGNASAMDVWSLVNLAYDTVKDKFQINLIPEIELIGEWDRTIMAKYNQMRKAA